MEWPIEHSDVTTIMGLLGDIQTSNRFEACWRTTVAKKKHQKLTPEELARREETHRMLRERIAYHEAKTREQEDAAERKRSG